MARVGGRTEKTLDERGDEEMREGRRRREALEEKNLAGKRPTKHRRSHQTTKGKDDESNRHPTNPADIPPRKKQPIQREPR
jgi:hypothetical protein